MNRACSFFVLLCASFAPVAAEKRTVVLYENPPLIILDGASRPAGIVPEFLRSLEVGPDGMDFDFVEATFPEAMAMIQDGRADILPGVARTYERSEFMDFSKEPLMRNRAVVFRGPDVVVSTVEDLHGQRVALLRDDVHAAAFLNLVGIYGLKVDVTEVETYSSAVELMRTGAVDLAVLNQLFAGNMSRDNKVVSTLISFNPIEIRMGYRKGLSPDFLGRMDRELLAQREDPESPLNRALFRYLSPSRHIDVPSWVWFLVLLLVLVLIAALFFNRLLRREVARQTEELRAERDRAQAADRAKAHFLNNVSHEIRTPLNGILGFCQLLESSEDLTPEDRESLGAVVESGHRLESVLGAILHYSSVVASPRRRFDDEVLFDAMAEEVVEILCLRLDFPPESFRLSVADVAGKIFLSDRNAWFLIIEGLMANAVRFGKGAPVEVRMRTIEREDGDILLHLDVVDGGDGIPESFRERVFLPFEQVDYSLTREFEGLGLGLSLVRAHVDLLGGRMGMEDEPEGGFRVWVEAKVNEINPPNLGKSC